MKKFLKLLSTVLLAAIALTSVASCARYQELDMAKVTSVIDVRTAAEFASGHLDGAVNIDVQSPEFASEISSLDPAGNYVVYCRSGNRAGQAIGLMQNAGFAGTLTNAGSVQNASELTKLSIVQ